MVKDAGLSYRDTNDNVRKINCQLCLVYCEPKLYMTKKSIGRHMGTARHKQALKIYAMEVERQARRARVGLAICRTGLQTFREGCNYL
jgi:Pyruvate/2-oxoacid:ferredoxin oxidoreductase delta subunit